MYVNVRQMRMQYLVPGETWQKCKQHFIELLDSGWESESDLRYGYLLFQQEARLRKDNKLDRKVVHAALNTNTVSMLLFFI